MYLTGRENGRTLIYWFTPQIHATASDWSWEPDPSPGIAGVQSLESIPEASKCLTSQKTKGSNQSQVTNLGILIRDVVILTG